MESGKAQHRYSNCPNAYSVAVATDIAAAVAVAVAVGATRAATSVASASAAVAGATLEMAFVVAAKLADLADLLC